MAASKAGEIRVSVTALADFACRSGDLVLGGVAGPTSREGIRAHRRFQQQALEAAAGRKPTPNPGAGPDQNANPGQEQRPTDRSLAGGGLTVDSVSSGLGVGAAAGSSVAGDLAGDRQSAVQSEVSLSCSLGMNSRVIELGGRIDLIDYSVPRLTEIKTTLVPEEQLPETQKALQWAQLYLYGFLFLHQADSEFASAGTVELEMAHVNIRADTQSTQCKVLSRDTLVQFAHDALSRYVQWVSNVGVWREKLTASAQALQFPHERFRPGQHDMAAAVYRTIRDQHSVMCEAPTGIGKTISSLFPACKAMGEAKADQVVYLTAKVAGRTVARKALQSLMDAGLQCTAVQIRAKKTTCFCSNGRCERDDVGLCPMTLGFFDRLPDARQELLEAGAVTEERFDEIAWQHQLCPFELALQMLPWVHVVIADFNYVFDPLVRLPHFSESRKDTVLLIDEAHNLVERSRNMFSAELSREACREVAKTSRPSHPVVAATLDRLVNSLLAHAREQSAEEAVCDQVPTGVARSASAVIESMMAQTGRSPPLPEECLELFRTLCRFVAIAELFSDQHRCLTQVALLSGRRKAVTVHLFCLDASAALARQYRLFGSRVFFSATLRPAAFYRDTLGFPDDTAQLQLSSPFPATRTLHAVVSWVDTRYRQREASLPMLLSLIHTVANRQPGNYLVFFPSYAYLEQVYRAYADLYPDTEIWKQENTQDRDHHEQLLKHLDKPGHRVGFVILGGVFGEGIDYVGDKLIGVVVVSTGLPGLDTRTRLVSEHYRSGGHDGYDFAYRIPGFTRVLQSVGRLIRHEQDRGVVVLVDQRFAQRFYRQLYPDSWQCNFPPTLDVLDATIASFWRQTPSIDN